MPRVTSRGRGWRSPPWSTRGSGGGSSAPTAASDGRLAAAETDAGTVACDLLLVSGGWNPSVALFSQSRGSLRYDDRLAAFVPDRAAQPTTAAGACAGTFDLAGCIRQGAAAGARAAQAAGFEAGQPPAPPPADAEPLGAIAPLWLVDGPPGTDFRTHFVDLEREVTVADLRQAIDAGLTSIEHIKRYTTLGTASDQGKTSGVLGSAIAAALLGQDPGAVGVPTFRPPYVPVSFALMAGRDRGSLLDPVRTTPIHPWHEAHGALFENVGQWRRARSYPRPGETMAEAVERECRAARENVAVVDVSTLGKIDIQGPDAGLFLDRVYTNAFSNLAVGSCRYGIMCSLDGMVFDDGVTSRLAEDRWHMTTTTGNAAAVLDHLEEWLQTEWPDLRVRCTSVTEQWAVAAVVGPRSREVLGALVPGLDWSAEAFPFMTWRDVVVAGIPARVFRISFSGELAYEINVPSPYGLAAWEAVMAAGRAHGIEPYGTEAIYVLRAEKGYPLIGQETDGSVSPLDLGPAWIVSRTKDFIGRRSLRRPDTSRADRKQLVALLPDGPEELLPVGAQLVDDPDHPIPVPMVGHVTSSYRSAVLGRTFALALVRGGRDRIGQVVHAPGADRATRALIADPVLFDPGNARRDGDGSPARPAVAWTTTEVPAPVPRTSIDRAGLSLATGVREIAPLVQVDLRVDPRDGAALERLEVALDFALPLEPNTVAGDPLGRHALWLGPDEWLIVEPGARGPDLETVLRAALDPAVGAVVDVSGARTALELEGPRCRDVLASGVALDIHPRAFGPGQCAQTLVARAGAILHQVSDKPRYRLLVRPSFAAYLAAWLADAIDGASDD